MTKKTVFAGLLLLGIMFLLSGCYPGSGDYDSERLAGFFWGLWHGLIVWFTLIGSLFSDQVTIYEVYNTGFGYNLGFLIGVGRPIGGGISCKKSN